MHSIKAKPLWMLQVHADLQRHEGFREYAYPDPLSKLGRKYISRKWDWGFQPGDTLLAKYGESWKDGIPWTVGYGFTYKVTPSTQINKQAADNMLEQIILDHLPVVDKMVPNWRKLPLFAQTVVINMGFNMGSRLYQFKNSMKAISEGDYDLAARNLRKSLWAKQVGPRAIELINRLERRAIAREHLVV